jgi:hypothetical protein
MSLSLFSTKNNYHKNGIWWFSKMFNRLIGEERYDWLRVTRRIYAARFYYARQQILYEVYTDYAEWGALLGLYPKTDSSHGFPSPLTQEAYRDFQENNVNTDGWFGMWILVVAVFYITHTFYSYMLPYYWIHGSIMNGEMVRLRMRDCIGSAVLEELYGNAYAEMGYTPHDFAYTRQRGIQGYSNPDDPRLMHMGTFNRKHKYKEHYINRVGDSHHMMYDK